MTSHRSFPKPGKGIPAAPKPRAPRAKPTAKKLLTGTAAPLKKLAKLKAPKAGPSSVKKPKPIDEGNGTMFVPLSDAECAKLGMTLAKKLHAREEEIRDQADTKKAMNERTSALDAEIHRLQTSIREKREERPAPGLFDKLNTHKEKPLAKDTMVKADRPRATGPIETNAPKVTSDSVTVEAVVAAGGTVTL